MFFNLEHAHAFVEEIEEERGFIHCYHQLFRLVGEETGMLMVTVAQMSSIAESIIHS